MAKSIHRLPHEMRVVEVRFSEGSASQLHTETRCWPSSEATTEPWELHCECKRVSHREEWSDPGALAMCCGVNASCPGCGAFYICTATEELPHEVQPEQPKQPEPHAPPARQEPPSQHIAHDGLIVSIDASGLASDARTRRVVELNDEWLDLTIRLDDLAAEKDKFIQVWRGDKEKVTKRIGEIRSELRSLKPGCILDDEQPTPEPPKQPRLPGLGS